MVTIGNSIPRVILCLILVTFSFAISGIMLDLGKMSMNLISKGMVKVQKEVTGVPEEKIDIASIKNLVDRAVYELETQGGSLDSDALTEEDVDKVVRETLEDAGYYVGESSWVGSSEKKADEIIIRSQILFYTHALKGARIGISFLDILKNTLLTATIEIPVFSRLLKSVIILLVAAYVSFKLFITIITSYLKIFVNVVLGPIQIAVGAIPGNFNSVTRWFKTILSNILVFPVIVAILEFSKFFALVIEPEKFVFFGQTGVFLPDGLVTIKGIFFIAGYLFAANAPNLIKGIIKVEEDKTMEAVGESAKKSMSKIPVIGGMFNG